MLVAFLLAASIFRLAQQAEVDAELDIGEGNLAAVLVDGQVRQHIPLHSRRHRYAVFLGRLEPGEHRIEIEGATLYGTPAIRESDAEIVAHAPILYARPGTAERLSDIPLLVYSERIPPATLQYTVIFSNEDGGTSTRALMARWGRTVDIEYVYRIDPASKRATIQAKDHQEIAFNGVFEGSHPVLYVATENNMVAAVGVQGIRYQLAPVLVDLTHRSRESVMDEHPWIWRVMSEELAREGKLRPYGAVEGEKISDPRNYLFIDYSATHRDSSFDIKVRLKGAREWHSSSLGRTDYQIGRDGWVRSTVELPPGTRLDDLAEINFECFVAQPPRDKRPAVAGICRLNEIASVFMLGADYMPLKGFGVKVWREIPSGRGITVWTSGSK
jgi:hypothetical protein